MLIEKNHNDVSMGIFGKIFQLKRNQGLPSSYHFTYNLQSLVTSSRATVGEGHAKWVRKLLTRTRAEPLGDIGGCCSSQGA